MTVTKGKDGKLSAKYIRTHTHHTPGIGEAKHLPLSQGMKQKVRKKYGQNVKLDSILDGMVLPNAKRPVLVLHILIMSSL